MWGSVEGTKEKLPKGYEMCQGNREKLLNRYEDVSGVLWKGSLKDMKCSKAAKENVPKWYEIC